MKKAEIDKAFHTLEGILTGIGIDDKINDKEVQSLISWCNSYELYSAIKPIQEIIEVINDFLSDGILDKDEKEDILWLCNNFTTNNVYFDVITSDIQKLQGILTGILADGIINDREIRSLSEWIGDNEQLSGTYPYDEINSLLTSILMDNKIDDKERAILEVFFSEFIAVCPDISIPNNTFCFTGISSKTTRNEIKDLIFSLGGTYKNTISLKTDYLIIGNNNNKCWTFSCYGRKVEQAVNMRKKGRKIIVTHENDFWDAVEDMR
jgi:NAD-dependent DNA ligase